MSINKEQYEKFINESNLFSLDARKEAVAYSKESLRMVENLYCYVMAINKSKYENYALEIVQTARRCIKNYDSSRGVFLNYFVAAWKKEYSHILGRQFVKDSHGGIKFSEEDERNIRRYIKYRKLHDTYCDDGSIEKLIASSMGVDELTLDNIKLMSEIQVTTALSFDNSNDELDIINLVADCRGTDDDILNNASLMALFDAIESAFGKLQMRQKALLSAMITNKILDSIDLDQISMQSMRCLSFCNTEILDNWLKTGSCMTAREIAATFGVKESSASRSYHAFIQTINYNIET